MKLKAKILTIVLALAMLFSIIGVFAIPASAASAGDVLFLKPSDNWKEAGANFYAWFFNGTSGDQMVKLSDNNGDGIYEVKIPSGGYKSVLFVRKNPSNTGLDWNGVWNQTADLVIPDSTSTKRCYNVVNWTEATSSWIDYSITVAGSFNGWSTTATTMTFSGSVATVDVTLAASDTEYEFKVLTNGNWNGNTTTIKYNTSSALQFSSGVGSNCKIKSCGGTYTFSYDLFSNKLTVTHQHEYIYSKTNDTQHTGTCACGVTTTANHIETTAATCKTAAYCATCKSNYGSVNSNNHTGSEVVANGTASVHSTYSCCGATYSTTHPDSAFGDWTKVNDTNHSRTCSCGYTETSAHTVGTAATCTSAAVCGTCGQSYGDLAEHSFTEQIQDEAHIKDNGNCQTHNVYWYDCSVCDTSAKGNDDSKYYTGTSYGDHNYVNGKCSLCGNYNHEHIPAEAVIENNQNPSCTVNGSYDSVVYCNVSGCGYEISRDHIVVDALGHKDDNNDHKCDRNCGKTDIGEHKDSATDKDHVCDYGCGATLNDCSDVTGDGNHTCDVCNKADVTDHSYAPATCTAPQTCSECGATTGAKLPHTYDQESTDAKYLKSSATCQSAAVYYKSCSCGASSKDTANEETFTSGSKVNHVFTADGCKWCDLSVIYLNPGATWNDGSGRFAVYFYNNTTNTWASMTDEDKDFVYEVKIPEGEWTNLIFVRMKASINGNDWANRIDNNQTLDLTFTEGKNCYVIEEPWVESQGWKATGSWTSYTYSAPVFSVVGTVHSGGWDQTSNVGDMTLNGEGVYEITFKNVAAGNHSFKIAMNHSWDYAWGNNDNNYEFTLETVACSVTIKFNFETKTITHEVDGEHNISSWTEVTVEDVSKHQGVCADCNATIVEDHVYTGDVQNNATHHWQLCKCGADNKTEHTYSGDWQIGADNHWKDCDSCGYDGHAGEHNYAGEVQKDGTYHWQTCSCGDTNKVEHNYNKTVSTEAYKDAENPATCTKPASYYYSCECGAKGTSTFTSGDIADHVFVTHDAVEATCLTAGNKIYYTCENCTNYFTSNAELKAPGYSYENFLLSEYYIAALGHDMRSVAAQDPTCTAVGWEAYEKCSRCDNSTYVEIPALNHKMDTTPFYRVDGGVLYQVTQCERYATCNHEVKTEASATVTVSNEADLRAVLAAGYNVKLTADIDLNAGCINLDTAGHDITIDLNGHKLVNKNVRVNEVVDVLWVKAALTVTITDSATGGAMKALGTEAEKTTCVISATDGAIINIKSGSFYSEGCTTIYATRGGKINISGGHYEAADSSFLIDINEGEANGNYGRIVITGGQFVDFNPANHTNDKPVSTNKISDGYHAIESEGVYTVGEHNYVAGTPVPVTCTTDGYTPYTCECGSSYNTITEKSKGHSFGEVVPKVDATCIDNGHEAYKQCTVCSRYFTPEAPESATGNIANTFITNQLEHSYTGEVKADDNGTTHSFKCINGCNEYGAAVDHADSATDNDHACDTCGEVLEECFDATNDGNHNCDVCGKKNVSDHDWAGNTCTAPQTCNECGATSGEPKGHKFTTNITCDNGCGTKAAAKVGENYYITVKKALETAKTAGVKDLVITIVGENDASTVDNFDLYNQSIFDSVILKQENGDKAYYFYDLYTGKRTNNGEFTFDGVNIVVTDQYMFEGNVRLANNSFIKSVAEANCFFYYSVTTVEPGSKLQGVIDELRGGTVIVDGGRTDGEYNTTPDMQDAIIYIRWSGDSLTVKNGAYVKINSANEVGRLTVSAGTSLNVYDSKVDSYQWIENNGTINVDVNSLITTGKITGSGKIVIDAADYNDSIGQVIDADLSGFTGEIEVINCEGLFATVDGNGRLTFTKAVASIDGKYYLTLQDAFNAVENGETIVLARDFELSATAVAPAVKFTIDLNGKTVTSADDYALNSYNQSIICVTRGTDLTINDSIGGGCLDASELYIAINLTRYGDSDTGECAKLTVNAGKYLGGYYAIAGNGSRDNTYIEINDGQFIGDISAIYHPQEGTLVITGGSFVGNGAGGYGGDAIGFLSGSLEISGGTFEGKALAAVSIENIGGTSGYQEIGTVSITGGTFISAEGYDSITSADEGGGRKISFISGGTFNTDLDLALLADGLALKQDGESYTVVNAVAQIKDGYGYASLADAVAAAQANDEINLLANDTITKTLDISKPLTINTGAFDITSKADVAFNITASNVTFKLNGKVIVSDPDAVANARSGGVAVAQTVLTMDDVADVTAILDAEFELGAGDVIYSGPVDNISLSVRDDYEAALNKKGYVTKDSTTPGMVDVTAKSLYYIGDDGYWYFDDVKTGVLAKGENGQSITITSYDKQPVKDGEFVVSHNYVITFSDGTEITINVPVARSIVSVEYDRTEGNKDIYVITYSDGSTSEFTVTNGTNGHSPVITIENGEWCIDGTPTGIKALGKDGKGIKSINKTTDGLVDTYTIIYTDDTEFEFTVTNGRGIVSISLTSTSADGLVDTYTITYNDGTTSTFTVTNGANGINGIQGEKGDDGHTPVITIQNGKWHIDGVDTGMQAQGVKGETGNGISDISKTGIDGLVDTYTITYTDGTTTTFTVTNGAQGAQGIQGIQGVPGKDGHTPVITIGENGNWFIDGADTGVKAEAIKGETGAPGADGEDGDTPYIGENGNWWIDGVDTGVKAEGKDGNDNNKIIIICIGIAALCIITTIVAVATKKFRRPWWILC